MPGETLVPEAPLLDAPLLDVRNLCVSFRSEKGLIRIIEDVSFTVGNR